MVTSCLACPFKVKATTMLYIKKKCNWLNHKIISKEGIFILQSKKIIICSKVLFYPTVDIARRAARIFGHWTSLRCKFMTKSDGHMKASPALHKRLHATSVIFTHRSRAAMMYQLLLVQTSISRTEAAALDRCSTLDSEQCH